MSRTGIVISIGMGIAVPGIDESAHGCWAFFFSPLSVVPFFGW
jgi:hypothetical protein